MKSIHSLGLGALAAAVLTACSGGGDVATGPAIDLTTGRGTLVANPPVTLASMPTAADVSATFSASATGSCSSKRSGRSSPTCTGTRTRRRCFQDRHPTSPPCSRSR